MSVQPQAAFAAALLDAAGTAPAGIKAWNGSDAGRRYAIYRNNVAVSLIKSLQDTFPVCSERLGEPLFRVLALRFVRFAPPRSPVLTSYGAAFPAFIDNSDLARSAPELADLARLEWLRVQAFHAADAEPLTPAQIAGVLAEPEQLPGLRFGLHPSVRTLASRHAVVSIWAAHRGLIALDAIDPAEPENAVIVRTALEVDMHRTSAGTETLLRLLGAGMPLGLAAAEALVAEAGFELAAGLATLMRCRLITAIYPPDEKCR